MKALIVLTGLTFMAAGGWLFTIVLKALDRITPDGGIGTCVILVFVVGIIMERSRANTVVGSSVEW